MEAPGYPNDLAPPREFPFCIARTIRGRSILCNKHTICSVPVYSGVTISRTVDVRKPARVCIGKSVLCCAVQALAEKVVQGIAREEGAADFNGIHLRMERDAADWAEILGGKENYWHQYRDAMTQAKFSKDVPLYVASGLLTGSTDINDKSSNSGDPASVEEMKGLAKDIIDNEVSFAPLRLPVTSSGCLLRIPPSYCSTPNIVPVTHV